MKKKFFFLVIAFFAFLSCGKDDDDLQKIDQIVHLYIDSAGIDMLNTNIAGAYTNVAMNDVYGIADSAPVSVNLKKDADTINYIEYLAGAKRIAIDSSGDNKTYESKIALILTKKVNDSTTSVFSDTLKIQYNFSPTLFQVSKVWYNDILEFTKVEGEPNIVKIEK